MESRAPLAHDDYVLGTQQAEIERLGLQHRVWRDRVLDCWRRAGIGPGQRVADVGAGPGFATLDLAECVGRSGHVVALERSPHFVDALQRRLAHQGLQNVSTRRLDLDEDDFEATDLDATWCRWVLSFVRRPEVVVGKIAAALKPGGRAVFHEYIDYRAWRLLPVVPRFDRFVDAVMSSWRAAGGEPDIALDLPTLVDRSKLRLVAAQPLTYLVAPTEPMWAWLEAFVAIGAPRLIELGYLNAAEGLALQEEFAAAKANPAVRMMSPVVLELVAVK